MTNEPTKTDGGKTATLKFMPPNEITGALWDIYTAAKQAYFKKNENASGLMAQYSASLSVFKAGFFQMDGSAEIKARVKDMLDKPTNELPVRFMSHVAKAIGGVIEAEIDAPLEDF